jgi:hypothetical protein
MSVKESAERLRALMIEKCPVLEQHFNPGLNSEECKALAAQYGVTLTQELIDFFGVINGFYSRDTLYRQVSLYHHRWFDTLEAALKCYKKVFSEDDDWWFDYHSQYFGKDKHKVPPFRFMGHSLGYFYAADLDEEERCVWDHQNGYQMQFEAGNLEIFLCMLCTKIENGIIFYDIEAESWEIRHTKSVRESAKRLRTLIIEKCPVLEKRFNPGLSPKECKVLAKQYNIVLTQELVDFYGVINGFDDIYNDPQGLIHIYNGRWFDTLKEALEHNQSFFYKWFSPEYFTDTKHKIPPLRFMGEDYSYFYAADLEGENRLIWSHFHGTGLDIEQQTLQEFLDMLCANIESEKITYNAETCYWDNNI